MAPYEIEHLLGPDEHVLWWSRGLRRPPNEAIEIAAIVAAFAIGGPFALAGLVNLFVFGLAALPIAIVAILLGAGVVISAYAAAATREGRALHTLYAITDRRLLFLDWRWPRGRVVREIPLTQTLYPTLTMRSPERGSISFRPSSPSRGWGDTRSAELWAFSDIEEPRAVYDMYLRLSAEAQRSAWKAAAGPPPTSAPSASGA